MRLEGSSGIWTRAHRADIATRLAGEALLSSSLPRVRACLHLIRKVLNESGELLDRDIKQYPVLDAANHTNPAAIAAAAKAKRRPHYR